MEHTEHTVLSTDSIIDSIAQELKPPTVHRSLFPVVVAGDGNCLFRSVSVGIFGKEDHHEELRSRVVMELLMNEKFFLEDENLYEYFWNAGSFQGQGNDLCDLQSLFRNEVLQTTRLREYGSYLQVQALANVVGCSIISHHPEKGPLINRNILTRQFFPRQQSNSLPIDIMWSSCREDMPDEYWVPNHVVALLKIDLIK